MVSVLQRFSETVGLNHLPFNSPNLRGKEVQIILIRFDKATGIERSLLLKVSLSSQDIDTGNVTWIGYERDSKGKILPKTVDMAVSMDPEK